MPIKFKSQVSLHTRHSVFLFHPLFFLHLPNSPLHFYLSVFHKFKILIPFLFKMGFTRQWKLSSLELESLFSLYLLMTMKHGRKIFGVLDLSQVGFITRGCDDDRGFSFSRAINIIFERYCFYYISVSKSFVTPLAEFIWHCILCCDEYSERKNESEIRRFMEQRQTFYCFYIRVFKRHISFALHGSFQLDYWYFLKTLI